MRLSRYLQTCCIEEAKFKQSIDKVNFFHDLEDRIEALLTALRPNQVIRRTTLTRQLEAATALRREWDRKRERAYHEWGLVLREKRNAIWLDDLQNPEAFLSMPLRLLSKIKIKDKTSSRVITNRTTYCTRTPSHLWLRQQLIPQDRLAWPPRLRRPS